MAVGGDAVARREALLEEHARRAGDGVVELRVGPGAVGVVHRDAFGVRRALRRSTPSTVLPRPGVMTRSSGRRPGRSSGLVVRGPAPRRSRPHGSGPHELGPHELGPHELGPHGSTTPLPRHLPTALTQVACAPPSTDRAAAACTACRSGRAASSVDEVDRSWAACSRRAARAQWSRSSAASAGARLEARGGLDDGLDLLAPVVVRDAEDGGVGDGGVGEQRGLDLGRVDVDAARDDHVDLAVAEEEVAVLVEIADVADGEEVADAVLLRLGLVLVVLEVRRCSSSCRRCRVRRRAAGCRRRRGPRVR